MGVTADPWEWGGLEFDSSWWGLIPWCVGGGHEVGIEGEGGQQVLKVKNYFKIDILNNIIK
jgi:hypothetical protein